MKKDWILRLKIGKPISSTFAVCSLHFLPGDYIPQAANTVSKKKYLKKNAVPSMNLPVTSHGQQSRKSNLTQQEREERFLRRSTQSTVHLCSNENFSEECSAENTSDELTPLQILADVCTKKSKLLNKNSVDCSVQTETVINNVTSELSHPSSVFRVLDDEKTLKQFTGLQSMELFDAIVKNVENLTGAFNTTLDIKGLVLVALIKIKLNLPFNIMSVLFAIPETSCKRYFGKIVFPLAEVLRCAISWPEKNEIVKNIPACFQTFRDVVVVLDCTEINVETPKCLKCRILTYSHYKGCNTIKILFGVSPAGHIIFISNAYGGRASDKFVTIDSGLLDKVVSFRDAVMVDKGFNIDDECKQKFIKLIRPCFVKGGKALSEKDALASSNIAHARVHVERCIQRFKTFQIFRGKLDWNMLSYINDLKDIAAGIVNLSSPILADNKF